MHAQVSRGRSAGLTAGLYPLDAAGVFINKAHGALIVLLGAAGAALANLVLVDTVYHFSHVELRTAPGRR